MGIAVGSSHVLAPHASRRIETLDLSRERRLIPGRVEPRYWRDSGLTVHKSVPGGPGVVPNRRHDADSSNDNSLLGLIVKTCGGHSLFLEIENSFVHPTMQVAAPPNNAR